VNGKWRLQLMTGKSDFLVKTLEKITFYKEVYGKNHFYKARS